MAVTIQYLVVRNGIDKMTFTNKKDADAYDRLLDLAEHLDELLADGPVSLNETDREALALYLAEHQDQLSGPKKKPAKKADKAANKSEAAHATENDDDIQAVA
ncbi:hypothetical protein GCM10022421_08420 [Oceanisphaera sediminis]|uniref:Damage-inducible protein YebG n=1 Tax=Oceanisphaera sediminis TaxID=981381 RepID=A0ABP7DD45_9GAMM